HRRRPVRHRVGSGDAEALRVQRLRSLAEVPDPGRVPPPRAYRHPRPWSVAGIGTRRGGWVVRAAWPLRAAADGGQPGPGNPLRARGPSGARGDRLLLGALGAAAVAVP